MNQLSVGFALETNDEMKHAIGKLSRKNFDMVILNSMNDAHATFGFDTNKIRIIHKDLTQKDFTLKTKFEVGKDIADEIALALYKHEQDLEENILEYESLYR
jgi:phosphopantothenoylcysteine decarboxylase / phosphopantothenate---cysteine ligase